MPSLICVAPEYNLLTWQVPGTRGIAASKQGETSVTLQAVACILLIGLVAASGRENLVPLQNGAAGHGVGPTTRCSGKRNYSFKPG